jgi:hypothetical protein
MMTTENTNQLADKESKELTDDHHQQQQQQQQ